MTQKISDSTKDISAEAQAILDIEKLRILDDANRKAGFNDGASRKAVFEHMNEMYISAEANPTEYIGALYQYAPEVGDRLEEMHLHAAAEKQFKKERGIRTKSL